MESPARPPKPASEGRPTRVMRRSDLAALQEDLSLGAECQHALLPAEPPEVPAYDLAVFYRGARHLSGDFYDFFPLSGASCGIVVADASGKGVAAALQTMICHAFFRAQPEPDAPPARVLANVNGLLSGNLKRGAFISAIYAVLDPVAHTLQVGNAGHLPLVVWKSRARIATIHPSKGPVLGVLPAAAYERSIAEEQVKLDAGDRFLLITDGVNEAMAPGQKEFGMEHLRKRLKADSDGRSADFLKGIVDQIEIHRSGGEQSDDITIVTGRRLV